MHDVQGILLDFDENAPLKTLANDYGGDQIRYVSGIPRDRLGLSAVLIRPDGIVAWASGKDRENEPAKDPAKEVDKDPAKDAGIDAGEDLDDSELRKAADRWFVRHSKIEH